MSKLVVLSEINCLGYLQRNGISPMEFYTDFAQFKNRSVSFQDVTVLVIFAGTCRFSKRLVLEFVQVLRKRVESEYDNGIVSCIVLSDTVLPSCSDYFLYRNTPLDCVEFNKWKSIGAEGEIYDLFAGVENAPSTVMYLLPNDLGVNEEALKQVRDISQYEVELREKIKCPKFE